MSLCIGARVCVHVYAYIYIYVYIHWPHKHNCMHAYIRTYLVTYFLTDSHVFIYIYTHTHTSGATSKRFAAVHAETARCRHRHTRPLCPPFSQSVSLSLCLSFSCSLSLCLHLFSNASCWAQGEQCQVPGYASADLRRHLAIRVKLRCLL